MKNLFIGLCLTGLSLTVYSQTVNDSLYLYKHAFDDLQFSKKAVSQLLALPVTRASKVQLKFGGQAGGYRQAQVAQRNRIAEFSAEGIATLNKFKVSGYFAYCRTTDDSLAWNQQGLPNEDRPYYFASAKAGPYQRDRFDMGAQLGVELFRGRWFIGSGIDYLYNTATRSVDPRPSVKTFRLMLSPELIYKRHKHALGVGITWGTGYEDNGISYTNDAYRANTSEIHKPWITYFSTGYGSAYPQRTNLNINRNQKYKGLKLSYSGNLANWKLRGTASYLFTEENSRAGLITSLAFENIANYQVDRLNAAFLLSCRKTKLYHQVMVNLSSDDGSGYYNRISGKNYYSKHKAYLAEYSLTLNSLKRTSPGFTAGTSYQNISKRDLSVYSNINYAWLQPYAGMALYTRLNKRNDFTAALDFYTLIPLNNELVAPAATVTEFTKGVVFPDYYYYKSLGGGIAATANYVSSSLIQGFRTGIGFRFGYDKKLSAPAVTLPANFIAGSNRSSYALNLNLYF